MADIEKTLPASDDDAVEKKEVALAQQVKQGAQKLIDLHASPAEQEPHSEAVGDDDKDAEITSILEDLLKAGADLSKVPGLADRLKGLAAATTDEDEDLEGAAAPAEDEDEAVAPAEDPAAAPAEDEDEPVAEGDEPAEDEDEPAAETDEGDMVADGLKACGLDTPRAAQSLLGSLPPRIMPSVPSGLSPRLSRSASTRSSSPPTSAAGLSGASGQPPSTPPETSTAPLSGRSMCRLRVFQTVTPVSPTALSWPQRPAPAVQQWTRSLRLRSRALSETSSTMS